MAVELTYLTVFLGEVVLETNKKVFKKKQDIRLKLCTDRLYIQYGKDDDFLSDGLIIYVNKIKVNLEKERFEITFNIKHSDEIHKGYFYFRNCHTMWGEFNY